MSARTGRTIRLCTYSKEVSVELEQVGPADPPLAIHRLYADRIANFIAMALGTPPVWVVYSPLLPLFLLLFTGQYMFVLPYADNWRGRRRAGELG
jgi:hypothetical protein